jgi:hypothetical protein
MTYLWSQPCRKDGNDDENYNRNGRKDKPKVVVLILSYHSSFEALVCKQEGIRIVAMIEREV